MLCSVPASKSGSNWLDRLRSNKGLPTGDNLDLDHFLTHTNSSSEFPTPNVSSSTESTRPDADRVANRPTTSCPNRDSQGEAFIGLMNNVLSELFFMGGSDERSKLLGKKIPRKQANPRVCVTSTTNSNSNAATANAAEERSSDDVRNDENVLDKAVCLDSQNSSLMKNKKELGNVGGEESEEVEEEEEEEKEEMRELKGYSISEVTVIDTSCREWKTEKLVFRRKNVWKVREKKAKVRKFGRRKRKVVDEEVSVEGGDDIDKKKAKVSALKEADGDECVALKSTEGQNSQNDTSNEVCKGTPDSLNDRGEAFGKDMPDANSKNAKKGFPLNRSPRKMKKGDSSVILIKGNPTRQ